MKKVAWGVLSTAKIGREKVLPALLKSECAELRAVASRELSAARALADRLGAPQAYGRYEDLLADPGIEAVYNPLPNEQHVPLTLAAARAGKHVLCEKPIALTADDAAQLREVADRVHVMEAFMVRFHPQWLRARERVRAGDLGELRAVQCWFSYYNRDAANIRNRPESGGGALYDIGCYPVVAGRFLFEAEPLRAIGLFDRDPQFSTDRLSSGLVDFGSGRRLDFTVSTQAVPYQRVHLLGTRARLEIEIPFNAPLGGPTRLLFDDGSRLDGTSTAAEVIPACDMYTLQIDAFSRAVRGQSPLPYGVEDAIAQARVLDALFASEHTGAWVAV